MNVGVAFPSYIEAWRDCEVAEASGLTHAWFYDNLALQVIPGQARDLISAYPTIAPTTSRAGRTSS